MKLSNNFSPEELLQHAQSLQQAGKLEEAAICFEKLRTFYPKFPPILNSLGMIYLQQRKFKEGCNLLEKSLQADYKQPMILFNLGLAYQNQHKYSEAISFYTRCIQTSPSFIDAHIKKGICLHYLEKFELAIECFNNAIRINPGSIEALNGKGISLYELREYTQAKTNLCAANSINKYSPEIHNNLGLVLHKLNEFEESLSEYNKAIELNPNYSEAYSNRGLTFQALQECTKALNDFNHCLTIQPNDPYANWNKALIKILMGEYDEGWALYEWRWHAYSKKWARTFKQPLWLGESAINNKTILIYPEQGFGDFIQFCRYIPILSNMGAKVILEVPAPLKELTQGLKGNIELIDTGTQIKKFDFQCPIMSLPLALKTTLKNLPKETPYLIASSIKIATFKTLLVKGKYPRVGLAWSGAKGQANDHNRSIPIEKLKPLLDLPFEFHSLQKEVREEDEAFIKHSSIIDHRSLIKDFSDTAALIECMDFVVSVDTAVAHLTGALNKKLFILLAFNADYRWLLKREDCPWYQKATLLRQIKIGCWDEPINALIKKLN